MVLLDEIRGRLCEVFSLKTYKIDHVVHGGIASAAVFGALMGATALQVSGPGPVPRPRLTGCRCQDRARDRHADRTLHPLARDPCRPPAQ